MHADERKAEVDRVAERYGIEIPDASAAEMQSALAMCACALIYGRENGAAAPFYRAMKVLAALETGPQPDEE